MFDVVAYVLFVVWCAALFGLKAYLFNRWHVADEATVETSSS